MEILGLSLQAGKEGRRQTAAARQGWVGEDGGGQATREQPLTMESGGAASKYWRGIGQVWVAYGRSELGRFSLEVVGMRGCLGLLGWDPEKASGVSEMAGPRERDCLL